MNSVMRPNKQRAKAAIILLYLIIAIEIIAIASSILQYDLLSSAANGEFISDSRAESNDQREAIITIIYTMLFLISAVTFIQWFRRAYFNLHQKVSYLDHSEGWAAGAWLIPFLNLVRPYQIMKELYEETLKLLRKERPSNQYSVNTNLIGWWWALWVISNISTSIVERIYEDSTTLEAFTEYTLLDIATTTLIIIAASLAVQVIKKYSSLEERMYALTDEGSLNSVNAIENAQHP